MKDLFSFYLVTDPHYFELSLGGEGKAYEERSRTDQKCVAETGAIIDAGFEQIAQDKETNVVLIPGDLVYRGEQASHEGFIKKLEYLERHGKTIYIITARHDYAGNPCGFVGDKCVPVEGTPREKESGNYIFAMTHYPLLPFSPVMNLIGDAKLTNWENVAEKFADAGLDLIFTGHMHAQAVTDYVTQKGNMITDVQTGSFVGCPCAYRKVTFRDDNTVDIKSYTVEDFDWDKGGRTASQYFQWRFDRMITDIIDAMAYDFAFFTRLFGGPEKNKKLKIPVTIVGRMLQKLTLKKLGRILCFKVDKSIGDRLVKDVGVELVRNIFVGNEPYVKGTPMYEAMKKLLRRLHPVTRIIEKKAGAKNPLLSNIDNFVLSMIGDEKQRDYNTVLNIKWKR